MTALQDAAKNVHLDVIKCLKSHVAEVNKGDNDGSNAFHSAAFDGHLNVIENLISQGTDVNRRDNEGWTTLHWAASNGHLDVTEYLISQGAEVNKGNEEGRSALQLAAFFGRLDVTDYLISHGADVNRGDNEAEVNEEDNESRTALQLAAQNGHLDVTKYLISQGAEQNGHLDITKYLISEGAEVNKEANNAEVNNDKGMTALQCAIARGHLDVTKYLISKGVDVNKGANDGGTALQTAAWYGHLNVTKYLISQGAEVNEGTDKGTTALQFAVVRGHLNVTKYLISQGAEVNRRNNKGVNALHVAAQNGHRDVTEYLITQNSHLDVTKYLISQGAKVKKGNKDGFTASQDAPKNVHLDVIKCLKSQVAEITGILDHRDDDGLTAIHLASQNGHTSVVESLVSHGASLNIQSHNGKTCLHEAIILSDHMDRKEQTKGRPKQISEDFYQHEPSPEKALVLYLLEHGANLDIRDGEGKLPIHYATNEALRQLIFSRWGHLHISEDFYQHESSPEKALVLYLLDHGANLDLRDAEGKLPIHYATNEVIRQMIFSRQQLIDPEEAIPLVTVSVRVDNGGKRIELEDVGISMSIPLGTVQESGCCEITLTSVQDPPSINSQGGESVACYGIRCDPPNMIFHRPVKIKIPHSAFIVNPDLVKPDIVCRVWDSAKDLPRTSRKRSSNSPDEPPYCKVYGRHLELYIGHSAEWWVLIPLHQQVIRHQLLCTPYIPDKIERGKEFEVQLQMHADVPGIEARVFATGDAPFYNANLSRGRTQSENFRVASKPPIAFSRINVGSRVLSLTDVYSKMRHNILLSVTPSEDDVDGITITITQAGTLGVSRSIAFIIRYTDGPEYQSPFEPPSFVRAAEEISKSELPDIDVLTISQTMTVDQFYHLGVALGFTIQQLDVIEYRRFHDREQAIYDMLLTWRERQPSGQAAKETLLSLMESLDSPAEELAIEIPDRTLLEFARQIRPNRFYEMRGKLGFNKSELQHMEHRTLYNRDDANIQMLSRWKASQTSGLKAKQTLKLVWDSVQDVMKAEKTKDEEEDIEDKEVAGHELEVNSISPPEQGTEQSESVEPEYMEIIRNSDSDGDETSADIDLCGGSPSTGEQCSVALPVKSLSLAWELGKALRLDNGVIVGFVAPSDSAAISRLAWQLLSKWCKRLGSQEEEVLMTKLLQDYKIQDCNAGRDDISKKICTTEDLLDLSQRLDLAASEIMQVMSTSMSFPPTSIRHIVLQMLQGWVRYGGTRQRLLEIAQAFHFNDAADKIATAMEHHPGFLDPFSHGIIDHDGGELKLDELDIRVSIPAGAILKGMRSVVTLSVPSRCSSKIPLKDGDVLITPVIECSFTQELLKPASVGLPHCIHSEQHQDDLRVGLYTKLEPGTFGYRSLIPNTSRDFHISEDTVRFPTRHLQLWGLSSSNVHGVQFTCEVFQPLFMLPSQKSTLSS
eukprot:XP_011669536.1 PREDICTED: uncharacterized protein LOC105440744 [Strongylocentrotus purpuratus]